MRKARDHELLDALDQLTPISFTGTAWRVVREGRDPLLGHPSGGRWDPGLFDVLYTALDPNCAIAEMHFHLSRQPVFPSPPQVTFTLNEIDVTTRRTLRFADLGALQPLGVSPSKYSGLAYGRTQEIGDAAAFLGFDGIIAPSARWDGQTLVVFSDGLDAEDLVLTRSSSIDWVEWRTEHKHKR